MDTISSLASRKSNGFDLLFYNRKRKNKFLEPHKQQSLKRGNKYPSLRAR